jgi:hypothetical protein
MKKLILTAIAFIGITATAQVKIGSNPTTLSNATSNFEVEGTTTAEQFVVLKNGDVGIGTTTPMLRLDVFKNTNVTTGSNLAIFRQGNNADGSNHSRIILGQVDTNNMYIEASNQANTKGILSLQPYGGNVGVGTAYPGTKLTVRNNTSNTGYGLLSDFVQNNNAGGTLTSSFIFGQVSTNNMFIEVADQANVKGNLNLQPFGGNVGIYTGTPTQKLQVNGSIRMVDGNEAAGKVMVSAADGTGAWGTISGMPVINSTAAPVAASGDVYVDPNGGGLIIKDTAGVKWRITVSTTGVLTTTKTSN